MNIKVGTRGSKLALAQTEYVISTLKEAYPDDNYEVVIIKTTGDNVKDKSLDKIGSKGVFVDKIEDALITDEIQMAVHSMKDMPDTVREGLLFAKSWKREDPRDVLILRHAKSLDELEEGALIATGSKRRSFQLQKIRPDIEIVGIRGNIDTRIRKLYEPMEDGRYLDGIILAAAGLIRLGRASEITEYFSTDDMIPAPAQGTLAIELRKDNKVLLDKINGLSDEKTDSLTVIERGFLKEIGADCHLPVAAFADKSENDYILNTMFGTEDGAAVSYVKVRGENKDILVKNAVDMIKADLLKQINEKG